MDKTLVLKNMSNFASAFLNVDDNEERKKVRKIQYIQLIIKLPPILKN